jgi:2-dehydropantoate 2-reductase
MRIVIIGAGAVGSVIGGRLHQGGAEVVLVGRPAHVEAIRSGGLRLRTAEGTDVIDVPAVASLRELTPLPDDVALITAKTQDTAVIHDELLAWNPDVPVVCGTNGVEHERLALRRFERVYGMLIHPPATYEHPGSVTALMLPTNALIDLGRYPHGEDDVSRELARLADASPHVLCESDPALMVKKYAKVLINLGNVPDAMSGIQGRLHAVTRAAIEEARDVYRAAGIRSEIDDPAERERYEQRHATMQYRIPEGDTFLGGSTWQGLAKGSPSTEIDWMNGEIVLLGRLHGVPIPHNTFLQRAARELVASGTRPGTIPIDELDRRWKAAVPGAGAQ